MKDLYTRPSTRVTMWLATLAIVIMLAEAIAYLS